MATEESKENNYNQVLSLLESDFLRLKETEKETFLLREIKYQDIHFGNLTATLSSSKTKIICITFDVVSTKFANTYQDTIKLGYSTEGIYTTSGKINNFKQILSNLDKIQSLLTIFFCMCDNLSIKDNFSFRFNKRYLNLNANNKDSASGVFFVNLVGPYIHRNEKFRLTFPKERRNMIINLAYENLLPLTKSISYQEQSDELLMLHEANK